MSPITAPGVPLALWEYMARQVKPAVEHLCEEDESSNVAFFEMEISFEGADAANVGRLLDYLDFMFRWTESVVDHLQDAVPPAAVEPTHHKVPVFEIVSTRPGSFRVRIRAVASTTVLVVISFLNLFNAAAEAIDHVYGWRHDRATVQTGREGRETSATSLPGPSDEAAHQAWQICGKPESFVELRSHFKTADGVDWYFSAKYPAHESDRDDLYLRRISKILAQGSD
ncbi:hypothetical protein AB0I82_17045 [Streptomyces sp. NPDC050315]|uniref:hypothetical protein n=1 Tax=Streptomyces sp. NPDC050315 TaxID=3155039 RepID=UPI00342CD6FB